MIQLKSVLNAVRRFVTLLVALGCATAFAAPAQGVSQLLAPDRSRISDPPEPIPEFELTDHEGRKTAAHQLWGEPLFVFFGFTHCPQVCPAAMQKLRSVQQSLATDDFRPVVALVSVDGERDTPAVMKKYLEPFGPGFIGLTGPPAQVRDLGAAFSAVFFPGMPSDAAGGYNVEHTSQIYLVDAQGRLAATFYQAPVADIVTVARSVLGERGRDGTD